MSYCQIILFKDGLPSNEAMEYCNSWGGAARIWDSLYDAYLKDPSKQHDSWLFGDSKKLWELASRPDLPGVERAVMAATLDRAFIRRENFEQYAHDLREFVRRYPVSPARVDHLPDWACFVMTCEADAIGLYATSVSDNPWFRHDKETGKYLPIPLAEGFEVYDWIAEQNQNAN